MLRNKIAYFKENYKFTYEIWSEARDDNVPEKRADFSI